MIKSTKTLVSIMAVLFITLVVVLPVKSGREATFTGGRPTTSQRDPVEFVSSLQYELNGGVEWSVEYLFETGFKTVAGGEFLQDCETDEEFKDGAPWWLGGLVFGYHRAGSGGMCETLKESLKGLRELRDGKYLDGGRALPNWRNRHSGEHIFGVELAPWFGGDEGVLNRNAEIFTIDKTAAGVVINISKGGIIYQKINLRWV